MGGKGCNTGTEHGEITIGGAGTVRAIVHGAASVSGIVFHQDTSIPGSGWTGATTLSVSGYLDCDDSCLYS